MKTAYNDVKEFHDATNQPYPTKPIIPTELAIIRRVKLILEEFEETMRAMGYAVGTNQKTQRLVAVQYMDMNTEKLVDLADGLADLIYVAVGTAIEFGIPLPAVWDEVQRANMAKRDPKTGKVRKNEYGKVLKPAGWTPPDIGWALYDSKESSRTQPSNG